MEPSPEFYCPGCGNAGRDDFDYGIRYMDGGGDNWIIYVICLKCKITYSTGYISPDN